jgi:hypothetical protein
MILEKRGIKLKEVIIEFIKTGTYKNIGLGQQKNNIVDILGAPEDFSISNKPLILKYGQLQLALYKNILSSIHIYFDENTYVTIKSSDFFDLMDLNNIKLNLDKSNTFENTQKGYKADSGVIVIFRLKNGDEYLTGMHLS